MSCVIVSQKVCVCQRELHKLLSRLKIPGVSYPHNLAIKLHKESCYTLEEVEILFGMATPRTTTTVSLGIIGDRVLLKSPIILQATK